MKKLLKKSLKPKNILFFIALFLLLSLGAHAVIHHDHPQEIFGENAAQAFLHGSDKKYWWMMILAAYLFIASAAFLLVRNQLFTTRTISLSAIGPPYLRLDLSKLFDPLRIALREGRLQRVTYE